MKKKTYRAKLHLKELDGGEPGQFRAEFATLNVIDHDGDVTEPGAFRVGQEVVIEPWNHNYSAPPVGKGVISEEDNKAICEGEFFLDTQGGKEHYTVVKRLGHIQEWSYTFTIADSAMGVFEGQDVQFLRDLDVWGVAPVTRGAGIDTRTTDIKTAREKGEDSSAEQDEGQAGDGEPSGPLPQVVGIGIDIELLED